MTAPALSLARVRVAAGSPEVSLAVEPGVHVLVGGPTDGLAGLVDVVAGRAAPRAGAVRLGGGDPRRVPSLRARIGASCAEPRLADLASIGELLTLAERVRGVGARAVAERLGLGARFDARPCALERREVRALDLAIALGTPAPLLLALEEPFVATGEREVVREALHAAAAAGAVALVVTASPADAAELGGTAHLVERGRVTRTLDASRADDLAPGTPVEIVVTTDDPRALAVALAAEPAALGLEHDLERAPDRLLVRARDLDAAALAIARAATGSRATVRSIAARTPGLDATRGATAGLASAAYHAAYEARLRWEAASAGPPRGGAGPAS